MPQKEKAKKKRSHLVRNLAIVIFTILIVWFTVSTLIETKPTMSANDFIIEHATICGYEKNGMKFFSITIHVRNENGITFHFVSSQIVFTKYTQADGTVISLNTQFSDNNKTFNALHESQFLFHLNTPESGPKIASIEFDVTVNVQEVGQPILRTFTDSTTSMNC